MESTSFPGQFFQPRVCPGCDGTGQIAIESESHVGDMMECPVCDGSAVDPTTPYKLLPRDGPVRG